MRAVMAGGTTVAMHVVWRGAMPMAAVMRPVMMAGTATFPTIAVPRILTVLVSDRERGLIVVRLIGAARSGHRHVSGKARGLTSEVLTCGVGDGPVEAAGQERHEQNPPDDDQGEDGATHGKPPSGNGWVPVKTGE